MGLYWEEIGYTGACLIPSTLHQEIAAYHESTTIEQGFWEIVEALS